MEKEVDPVVLEILRLAKELVINEYTDRRANVHNQWLVDAETAWRTRRAKVPYPVIPPYPTELDIVLRAQVLLNFLNKKEVVPQTIEKIETPKVDTSLIVEQTHTPTPLPTEHTPTPTPAPVPVSPIPTLPVPEPAVLPIEEVKPLAENLSEVSTSNELIPEPVVVITTTTATIAVIEESIPSNIGDAPTGRILPSFLRKLEEMKNLIK